LKTIIHFQNFITTFILTQLILLMLGEIHFFNSMNKDKDKE